MMIVVHLTAAELMQAALCGMMRRVTSILEGYDKNKHAEKSDWATDIDGAVAELAFAKSRNWHWSAANRTFKEPDVGVWHVRSTCHRDGHLIVRPNDDVPEALFVLGITKENKVGIVGWMTAGSARVEKYWREDKNGWWVPQGDLTPINEPSA